MTTKHPHDRGHGYWFRNLAPYTLREAPSTPTNSTGGVRVTILFFFERASRALQNRYVQLFRAAQKFFALVTWNLARATNGNWRL